MCQEDTEPWSWKLSNINDTNANKSPTLWPTQLPQLCDNDNESIHLDTGQDMNMNMEQEWNIIDYVLDDLRSPDLVFPVELGTAVSHVDQGK